MAANAIRIGILGDFHPEYHSHLATNASLQHAARAIGRAREGDAILTLGAGNVSQMAGLVVERLQSSL